MAPPRPRVAILVHDGYQELEFWYPVLRLREEGCDATVLGMEGEREYVSRLGYPVIPDKALGDVRATDFDAVVVPGGASERIAGEAQMVSFVAEAAKRGAVLAAASGAAKVLAVAGLLDGKEVAPAPGIEKEMAAAGARLGTEPVASDGKVVTSRSPDALPAFFQAFLGALAPAQR